MCNESIGLFPCMDGTCFQEEFRCDGTSQCTDNLDEMGCKRDNEQNRFTPPLLRYKHTTRHFEEDASWLWKGHFTKYEENNVGKSFLKPLLDTTDIQHF